MDTTTKTCNKCNTEKPVGAFYRLKKNIQDRQAQCIICKRAASQVYYGHNQAKILKTQFKNYHCTPEQTWKAKALKLHNNMCLACNTSENLQVIRLAAAESGKTKYNPSNSFVTCTTCLPKIQSVIVKTQEVIT